MIRKLAAIAAAAMGLGGCMDLITGGPLILEGRSTGEIEFVNATNHTFDVVLISECGVGSYGLNRLQGDDVIPPGKSYRFTVSEGCWDVGAGAIGIGDAMHRLTVNPGQVTRYTVN